MLYIIYLDINHTVHISQKDSSIFMPFNTYGRGNIKMHRKTLYKCQYNILSGQ
jgi:hypothetical protein